MAATTYAALQTEIISYLHRVDLAAQVPLWIEGALQRINNDLIDFNGIPNQEQVAYANAIIARESLPLPNDYQALMWIKLENSANNSIDPLELMDYDSMLEQYGITVGPPCKFAIIDEALYLRPIPDAAYTIRIGYLKRYQSLTSPSDSNYLLTNGGNIMLYAALLEAEPWVMDDARVNTWAGAYKVALDNLRKLARRMRVHRPPQMVVGADLLAIGNNNPRANILTGQ